MDDILTKLDGNGREQGYVDPRNCLVFWARPTQKVKNLIEVVQQKLRNVAPGIWLMPIDNLHMTAMEVAHSLTAAEIDILVEKLLPVSEQLVDLPSTAGHRARLIKPLLSFDSAALALSFVPAAGEALSNTSIRSSTEDEYTYHHLRRDLHGLIMEAGVSVGSRYVVPSAHLTIARFNSPNPFDAENWSDESAGKDAQKRAKWIREINTINSWLEAEFWPNPNSEDQVQRIKPGGEWIVGDEKGLDFRKGTLWCK